MSTAKPLESAFGLSWVLPVAQDLITKSLAPSFIFVDHETFVNTNVEHRLDKRMIDAYVSIPAPFTLLSALYGGDEAVRILSGTQDENAKLSERSCSHVLSCMESAVASGASALILCDDLIGVSGPLLDPLFVIESCMPLYARFVAAADELGMPLLFHAKGDIREYYAALAETGFSGVHVVHPEPEKTRELFKAAWANGLMPAGGIVGAKARFGDVDALADLATELSGRGPALICDDGGAETRDEYETIVRAFIAARDASSI